MPQQNNILIPISILLAGAMIAGAVMYSGSIHQTTNQATEQPLYKLEGFASKGDPEAPVTIVEYSDYACPFCKRHHEQTKNEIIDNYVEEGLVYYVRKDFVAVGGDKAAEAAHCAAEQDAYWAYADLLYSNQTADRTNWTDPEVHRGYANELSLDADALVECFTSGTYRGKVAESTREAQVNGGSGTPFFLVNDIPISGAQTYTTFVQAIEASLAESN